MHKLAIWRSRTILVDGKFSLLCISWVRSRTVSASSRVPRPTFKPDDALELIKQIGHSNFGPGAGDADGADEQVQRAFLAGETHA